MTPNSSHRSTYGPSSSVRKTTVRRTVAAVRPRKPTNDAEAIAIAARQPEMRFVAPKTAEQQAKAVMFRSRERLVHHRTELVNALRAVLYEYRHVFPAGLVHLKRVEALVEDQACDLPALIIAECRDLLAQIAEKPDCREARLPRRRIAEKTERIDAKTKDLKALAAETDTARRLQTMPGSGPGVGAGGRASDGAGGRGFRARHGAVQTWPRFVRGGNGAAPVRCCKSGAFASASHPGQFPFPAHPGWGSCLGSIPPQARSGLGVSRRRARGIFDGF